MEDSTQRSQPAGLINQDIEILNTNASTTKDGRKRQAESSIFHAETGQAQEFTSENFRQGKKQELIDIISETNSGQGSRGADRPADAIMFTQHSSGIGSGQLGGSSPRSVREPGGDRRKNLKVTIQKNSASGLGSTNDLSAGSGRKVGILKAGSSHSRSP